MSELELTVLQRANDELGHLAGVIVTDEMIVGLGGISNRAPTVVASANARDFEVRDAPGAVGLRGVIAVADAIWACGEYGQLAVSRDHGASWVVIETGTDACLFGLALAADGALWVVGDHGYAARILGTHVIRIDLGTTAKLTAVYAIRDELVVLGADGLVRRWRAGDQRALAIEAIACGAKTALTGLAITSKGTWLVVGDGGFIARSPDGQWYSRASSTVTGDLEAIATLPDGATVAVGDRGQIVISRDDGRTWRALACDLGLAHLWSITRFGGGVLIGGDRGLIVKLAPPGDVTWRDRGPALDVARSLDAVFA
ncbi:MAG: hypothetical protein M3619_34265, partial [Myxococcota bacterium]|nr:hypothetical protein [Myxococcota bacterium]